jgi:MoaD family protein
LIKVKIHTILNLKKVIGNAEVEILAPDRGTLRDLIEIMLNRWGDELASQLYGPDGTEVLPYIRLMVNGRDIGFLKGMETVLQNGDEILILPPVAGG